MRPKETRALSILHRPTPHAYHLLQHPRCAEQSIHESLLCWSREQQRSDTSKHLPKDRHVYLRFIVGGRDERAPTRYQRNTKDSWRMHISEENPEVVVTRSGTHEVVELG